MFAVGDRVEFVGDDSDDEYLYRGHPGQVWTVSSVPSVTVVGFVNGPSLDFSTDADLRRLDLDEYIRRGRRLVAHRHPLDDRDVATLMAPGHEWPEGAEPSSG